MDLYEDYITYTHSHIISTKNPFMLILGENNIDANKMQNIF